MTSEFLPALFFDIRADLGDAAVIALGRAFAGQRIYVPKCMNDDRKIVLACGREVAEWLAARYGGSEILVPLANFSAYAAYTADVDRLIGAGASTQAIVRMRGVSERTVYRRRAKKAAARQPDLFDQENPKKR